MTADESKKWGDFLEVAQTILFKGQEFDKSKPYLNFAIEPSFDNSLFLQLSFAESEVRWYRTTWDKLVDAPKFTNPLERLKYVGKAIVPSFIYESGSIGKERVKEIIHVSETLIGIKMKESRDSIVLDGTHYTLTIALEPEQTPYTWTDFSNESIDLEKLCTLLEELNSQL